MFFNNKSKNYIKYIVNEQIKKYLYNDYLRKKLTFGDYINIYNELNEIIASNDIKELIDNYHNYLCTIECCKVDYQFYHKYKKYVKDLILLSCNDNLDETFFENDNCYNEYKEMRGIKDE